MKLFFMLLLTNSILFAETQNTALLTVTKAGLSLDGKSISSSKLKSIKYQLNWREDVTFGEFRKHLPKEYRLNVLRDKTAFYTKVKTPEETIEHEAGPRINIYIFENYYMYQGSKKTLKDIKSIFRGITDAMGEDVTFYFVAKDEISLNRITPLLKVLPKNPIGFRNKIVPGKRNKSISTVLTTVTIENVEEEKPKKKDKKKK